MRRLISELPIVAGAVVIAYALSSGQVIHAAVRVAQTVGLKTFVNAFDENNQPKVVELTPCPAPIPGPPGPDGLSCSQIAQFATSTVINAWMRAEMRTPEAM